MRVCVALVSTCKRQSKNAGKYSVNELLKNRTLCSCWNWLMNLTGYSVKKRNGWVCSK